MDSISKTPIDHDLAQRIVSDAFGPTAVLAELEEFTEGWFNAVYLLRLDDGRAFVVKIAPRPEVQVLAYERDILHAEIEAMRLVATHTDVPAPHVLSVDERCVHVPSPLFVMTHVPGISVRSAGDRIDAVARAGIDATIGRHLRAIHDITSPTFGLLAPHAVHHRTWRRAFGDLFESVLADGERRSVPLPITYAAARGCLHATGPSLDEVTTPRLVLWDLWDGNLLIDPHSLSVLGIIDLERALWGDPLLEAQFLPSSCSPAFLEAYGRTEPLTPAERQRRALYTFYLHLVMSIEGTYRQYPEDPIGEWARTQLAADIVAVHQPD
jgi:aminoglycoside phosphotransferase (APT) family kinase protein